MSLPKLLDAFLSLTAVLVFPFAVSTYLPLFHRVSIEHTISKLFVAEGEASALGKMRPAMTNSISDLGEIQTVFSSHDML